MKKALIPLTLIAILVIVWKLYPTKEVQKQVSAKKVVIPWEVKEMSLKTLSKEQNSTVNNKKPTVMVYAFSIGAVGDIITFYSKVKDEDGNISS